MKLEYDNTIADDEKVCVIIPTIAIGVEKKKWAIVIGWLFWMVAFIFDKTEKKPVDEKRIQLSYSNWMDELAIVANRDRNWFSNLSTAVWRDYYNKGLSPETAWRHFYKGQ